MNHNNIMERYNLQSLESASVLKCVDTTLRSIRCLGV